jgi:Zn-dependent oligopeptidase
MGYYANKLKQEKYAFDSRELKKYFVYENVLAGLFETTKRLYNLEMKKTNIESYSEEVEIYEVYRNGTFLSYYFTDFFYTPLKRQ